MGIGGISLKNLSRRKVKSFLILFVVFLISGTIVALSSVSTSLEKDIADKLDRFGANILVVPGTDAMTIKYGDMILGSTSVSKRSIAYSDSKKIRSIPLKERISSVLPVYYASAEVDGREVTFLGTDLVELGKMKPWWSFPADRHEKKSLWLGSEIAEILGKREGDRVSVSGQPAIIGGVLPPTGDKEDYMVVAAIDDLWMWTGQGGTVSAIEVSALCKDCPVSVIVSQISTVLPGARVTSIKRVVESRERTISQLKKFAATMAVIIAIIGAMVISVTVSASVTERAAEIGVMRAIGFRKSWILSIIMMETGFLSVLGSVSGVLGGVFGIYLIAPVFDLENVVVPLSAVIISIAIGILMGISASYRPAKRAALLDPVEALRNI
ncbi:MAG: FtsX-like permease family protein [Deltaproteobacteria bacterium]|nr:FtsX-like permease family protein [Deltaproteobacteria bacterium]